MVSKFFILEIKSSEVVSKFAFDDTLSKEGELFHLVKCIFRIRCDGALGEATNNLSTYFIFAKNQLKTFLKS